MENKAKYTIQEKRIDQYLGTNNLRPGPPRKLIYKMENIEMEKNVQNNGNNGTNSGNNKLSEKDKKKVNYFAYSREIKKDINWDE